MKNWIALYANYSDLSGEPLKNKSDVSKILSRLGIHDVIRRSIVISNTYNVDLRHKEHAINYFNNYFIRPELLSNLPKDYYIFHREQLLTLLNLALLFCPEETDTDVEESDIPFLLGDVCLMVSDLLTPEASQDIYELAQHSLPSFELYFDNNQISAVGRAVKFWVEIPFEVGRTRNGERIDFRQIFEKHYGCSLKDVICVLFMILLHLEQYDPAGNTQRLVFDVQAYVSATTFSKELFYKVVNLFSTDLKNLRKSSEGPTLSILRDYTDLKRYPLIMMEPNVYICHDIAFFRRLFTDGIYSLVLSAMSAYNNQNYFQTQFGTIFEKYIGEVLSGFVAQSRIVANARFVGTQVEVADFIISGDKSFMLFEAKASLLTPFAKYSGKVESFKADIKDKFISTESGHPKGVTQLANSIVKLLAGEQVINFDADIDKVWNIFPCLVTYDVVMSSPIILAVLSQALSELISLSKNKKSIKQLMILSVADLEIISGLPEKWKINSDQRHLNYLFQEYFDRRMYAEPFSAYLRRNYAQSVIKKQMACGKAFMTALQWISDYIAGAETIDPDNIE